MTLRSESRLERLVHHGLFVVTSEIVPPRSADPDAVARQARELVGYADAVNVTDNPTARAHMSAIAGVAVTAAAGVEPVLQVTGRDRNRLALTGDLLGAWALGARNVLCLTGDPPSGGDHPNASGVYDLSTVEIVRLAAGLREGRLLSGDTIESPPSYFIGVADLPLEPNYSFDRLEEKIAAGADFVQTQIVFDADAFGEWAERARPRGVFERVFVLAGIAVPRTAGAARYLREHVRGVVVPDAVLARLDDAGPDAAEEGVRIAVELAARMKTTPGIAGIHVMGLGHAESVRPVVEGAGLLPRPAVAA
ncbi:MAG TPA: methylenetetrahydrofolate reductase [Actinomycetota bacterium]|nr:methylenetetrahydrofolate reductase [Actinomycetota bacterium]